MTSLPPNTLLLDLHPTRFIKVQDFTERWKVESITVTVEEVTQEQVMPKPNTFEIQPVLYFRNKSGAIHPQGFLLAARVNVEALASATGARTIGEAVGKKIKIVIGTHKKKKVLRIDPNPVQEN